MKKTLKQLLRWAKGRCYIEIKVNGWAEIEMMDADCYTLYDGNTLYKALQTAYRAETGKEK